ncbi:MAG: hypothetical protein LBU62_02950 [Bacteroidales bacterium]|jgi:hypothetical protein|nr:hypothetical protein [Bacteroidales bacterium]
MKKIIIILSVLAILSGIIYYLYPKYQLYQKVKDWDQFSETAFMVGLELTNHYEWYYEYPVSADDSLLNADLIRNFGYIPAIYNQIFFKNDTLKKEDVIKVFLKGPNHNINHPYEMNPFDYESGLISPVHLAFLKFIFQKGDILMGILSKNDLCDANVVRHPSTFFTYQGGDSLDYDKTKASFYNTVNTAINATFVKETTQTYSGIFGRICYKAHLQPDTLILIQKCEPFDGKYDTSPMIDILNRPLYEWAKSLKLKDFNFSIKVIPAFFPEKPIISQSTAEK